MQLERAREMVRLVSERDDLETRLAAVKQQIDELQSALAGEFIESGVNRLTVDGRTLFLTIDMRADPVGGKDALISVLKQSAEFNWLVRTREDYNWRQLQAAVKDLPKSEDGRPILPDELKDALQITYTPVVRVRK